MPYWVHRFVSGNACAWYRINENPTEQGEQLRSPDNEGGWDSIGDAEAALSSLGIENGATWYIHRTRPHDDARRSYTIDHSSSNHGYHKTCPATPPGYDSIVELADASMLSELHDNDNCGVLFFESNACSAPGDKEE